MRACLIAVVITLLSCQRTLESTTPSNSGSGSVPGSGPGSKARPNQRFREAEVRAFHKCVATAPPTVSLLLSGGHDPDWIQIDLAHGPSDRVPRTFKPGEAASIAGCCGPGNAQPKGTVTLDTLDVGRSATGRYSLVFPSGQVLDDAFEAAWKEQPWMVQPCTTPPDAYPQKK